MRLETDFLIIGSGIAGLSLALKLARLGHVTVITKKTRDDTATTLAQGGIACVCAADDSFELHARDTFKAGDGLCHEEVVEFMVREAPERIRELEALGVKFHKDPGGAYSLHMEGGHSRRRILHCKDYTGKEIQRTLMARVMEEENIELLEDCIAVDLITHGKILREKRAPLGARHAVPLHIMSACNAGSTHEEQSSLPSSPGSLASGPVSRQQCRLANPDGPERCVGAYVLESHSGNIHTVLAHVTILATGGAGKVYLYTSNPDVATGDGIAMAWRAGARVANLEFVQFHPTCLFHPKAKNFLISEALRGEGAFLLDPNGRRFMGDYAPDAMELASRDIVARAIDTVLKRTGADCVFLDISHKPDAFIKDRFPTIYEKLLCLGIDITREPIPVVPAAHYMCGGVVTDHWGRTDLVGLYAIGETACTGFHGANRLASNSLLEGVVMAQRAFIRIEKEYRDISSMKGPAPPDWNTGGAVDLKEAVLISHNWDVIRRLMWNYVGVVRNDKRLGLAAKRLRPILEEINQHYWDYLLTRDFVELRNLAQVAELIVEAALWRKESRGGHYNEDYPWRDDWNFRQDTVLKRIPVRARHAVPLHTCRQAGADPPHPTGPHHNGQKKAHPIRQDHGGTPEE